MKPIDYRAGWNARAAAINAMCARVGFRADATPAEELQDKLDGLRAQQDRLLAKSQQVLNAADAEGRELKPEERHAIERRAAEVERLDGEAQAIEARLSTPQARRTDATAGDPLHGLTQAAAPARRIGAITGSMPRNFAAMFPQASVDPYRGAFASLGEFALAAATGNDGRLRAATMTTGVGVDGAFLVPPQFIRDIMDQALAAEIVRPRANVVPMIANEATAALFDYQDGTGAKRAGLQLTWGAEAATLAEQKAKARDIVLKATKGNIFCRVSAELAADAVQFGQQLSAAMVEAVASGLDYAFLWGSGVAQPLGVMNSGALITVSKEGGQAADTVLLPNLAKMVARVTPASYARSVWQVHPTLVPQLYQLSYTVKNVAGTENVGGSWAQAVTVDPDGTLRIFGRPCLVTDACAPVGDLGDIVLIDWSRYLIGMRQDVTIKRDDSRYFDSDEVAFKLTLRLTGLPTESTATKLRDGTNTVSPYVTLEAR